MDNFDFFKFCSRIIRAFQRRVSDGDVASLMYLLSVAELAEDAARDAAVDLNRAGYSWQEIGNALGVSRQAAHQRFTGRRTVMARSLPGQLEIPWSGETPAG
jgi:hypothetical protein